MNGCLEKIDKKNFKSFLKWASSENNNALAHTKAIFIANTILYYFLKNVLHQPYSTAYDLLNYLNSSSSRVKEIFPDAINCLQTLKYPSSYNTSDYNNTIYAGINGCLEKYVDNKSFIRFIEKGFPNDTDAEVIMAHFIVDFFYSLYHQQHGSKGNAYEILQLIKSFNLGKYNFTDN
jgi:hypothetical protein